MCEKMAHEEKAIQMICRTLVRNGKMMNSCRQFSSTFQVADTAFYKIRYYDEGTDRKFIFLTNIFC
jgi:hypothetical protein